MIGLIDMLLDYGLQYSKHHLLQVMGGQWDMTRIKCDSTDFVTRLVAFLCVAKVDFYFS